MSGGLFVADENGSPCQAHDSRIHEVPGGGKVRGVFSPRDRLSEGL